MSSIDDSQRTLLMRFFEKHLKGRTANPRRVLGLERGNTGSYYLERSEGLFPRERFELSFSDAAEIAASLDQQWAGGPYEGLGSALMELSKHFERVEEKKDVSEFVYEMF
ncbi:MAG: hypothetical protein AMJ63_12490 [Myxococcales bacterium SG8_38_1]|jgi:hypothetical protein|nr:MAG: hypothetical protein AMJ63_12490 [Myxococcales bacterium SG8_38_1]